MRQVSIIPNREHLAECLELAKKYNLGFEYNDFFMPDVLDDIRHTEEIIAMYQKQDLPAFTTLHGAFFDVIPFSMDAKIHQIAEMRIEQSIRIAEKLGAKAVIFHTNYNPFLNSEDYIKGWIQTNAAYLSKVLERHPDINIYLENMFDTTPDIMEALSEKLSVYANYGVCLDYAHASLSKAAPEVWAKQLGRFVKHVHMNDNDLVSDLHLAWGDGQIDRNCFYECMEIYLKEASVLIETTPMDNKIRSLEMLQKEGFIK